MNLVEMLALAGPEELAEMEKALAHERAMRAAMADTGESRETIQDVVDAMDSMQQEAVLKLTDGDPTTLHDALGRYVESLEAEVYGVHEVASLRERVASDLHALLNYPWPGSSPKDWAATGTGNTALTQEIHEAYLRLALERGFEMVPWNQLTDEQRDLALAVMADVVRRGVIRVS